MSASETQSGPGPATAEESVSRARDAALRAIAAAATLDELHDVRVEHAGDRSPLARANQSIGQLRPDQRKAAGQRIGQARKEVSQALSERSSVLERLAEERMLREETVDVTLPWDREPIGARHPLTTVQDHVSDVFVAMGWEVAEGPEVEAEWLNFDALNLGPDHPARTMHDTFWVQPENAAMVLRTHTSPVQARTMLTRRPPIYVICPGRVFRTDELDATHSPAFHPDDGLAGDTVPSMPHLTGPLDHFAQVIYADAMVTRFRPSYFPFTEPSAEMDLLCYVCHNDPDTVDTCGTCRGEGWVEWGGCGVVNPRVLTACGVDPDVYSGFAFGIGLDRTITGRYDIADLRDLVDGDIRFTAPFGVEL